MHKKIECLKNDANKLIENLHYLIKIEKELFISEKKQNLEYINSLKNKIFDIKNSGNLRGLELEIPGKIFYLIFLKFFS